MRKYGFSKGIAMAYLAKMLIPNAKAFNEFSNRSLYNDYEELGE
jgi:hypothetical protein